MYVVQDQSSIGIIELCSRVVKKPGSLTPLAARQPGSPGHQRAKFPGFPKAGGAPTIQPAYPNHIRTTVPT